MENNDDLGTLNDYIGPQKLDAEIAKDTKTLFACVGIERQQFEDSKSPTLQIHLQNAEIDYYLNLNKTNLDILSNFMKELKFDNLKNFVGCVFAFDKINVTNPKTGKPMKSLIIDKITTA
jgi:hypothetical protein